MKVENLLEAREREEACVRFSILASGSSGNSALVEDASGRGILIDFGLGPRVLNDRLEAVGASWKRIGAVLITHTHSDHVEPATFSRFARDGVPVYCHKHQLKELSLMNGLSRALERADVRHYDDRPFLAPNGMRVEPFALSHDTAATYGFRIEGRSGRRASALGYLADTGTWTDEVASVLADVDLLAVEFNHDVALQRESNRSIRLITRVLGPWGHLSNEQAASLLVEVLKRSETRRARHVVLLHLSRECNRPELAEGRAKAALKAAGVRARVHVADQDRPLPPIDVAPGSRPRALSAAGSGGRSVAGFPWE